MPIVGQNFSWGPQPEHLHWTVFYCFCGMSISKLMDTFKNQLNLPTGHYFISSSHKENTLIPTQYPHKSQLFWCQAQARVPDFTLLVWCKWGWDAWVVVSAVSPLRTIPFNRKIWEPKRRVINHPTTQHSVKLLKFPMQKWKMGGLLVHSNSESLMLAACSLIRT